MNPYAYITVIMIWGTTPLGVQWSAQGASPFIGALLRMLIAFVILVACIRVFKIQLPLSKAAFKVYGVSVLGQGCAMLLVYWSSSFLPSSLISLLFGLSPLMTGLLAWFLYQERLTAFQIASIGLGVVGLIIVFSKNIFVAKLQISPHYFHALACMFIAVLLFSLSNIWVKRTSIDIDIHPLAMTMGSLSFALPLYFLCFFLGNMSLSEVNLTPKSAGAIIYLAVFGSVLAPYCFFLVLKTSSASLVALITVAAPVIALFLGAFLNNELVGMHVIVGSVLVLVSLLLYQFESAIRRVIFRDLVVG